MRYIYQIPLNETENIIHEYKKKSHQCFGYSQSVRKY